MCWASQNPYPYLAIPTCQHPEETEAEMGNIAAQSHSCDWTHIGWIPKPVCAANTGRKEPGHVERVGGVAWPSDKAVERGAES